MEWQEYTEELYKKDLQDNYDGMITHLEPDILECEVKGALESITVNKGSGSDRIPAELFQILKMMLLKCCTPYVSKFGKQFSFQFQRRAIPKNIKLPYNCIHFTY